MAPFFGTHIALEHVTSQSSAPVSCHDALFFGCVLKWSFYLFPLPHLPEGTPKTCIIFSTEMGSPSFDWRLFHGRGDIFQHAKVPCARLWGSDDSKNCTVFLFAASRYPGGACHHGHLGVKTVKTHRFFTEHDCFRAVCATKKSPATFVLSQVPDWTAYDLKLPGKDILVLKTHTYMQIASKNKHHTPSWFKNGIANNFHLNIPFIFHSSSIHMPFICHSYSISAVHFLCRRWNFCGQQVTENKMSKVTFHMDEVRESHGNFIGLTNRPYIW
jgi:hypothetical protein